MCLEEDYTAQLGKESNTADRSVPTAFQCIFHSLFFYTAGKYHDKTPGEMQTFPLSLLQLI